MKTKLRKYMGMAALLMAVVMGLSSCEVEIFDDRHPSHVALLEEYLCEPVWTDIWEEGYHLYEQRFIFYRNGQGREYFMDNGRECCYDFYWRWDRGDTRCIRMDYADGVSYLDDIVITRGVLRGYLNNEPVEFIAR